MSRSPPRQSVAASRRLLGVTMCVFFSVLTAARACAQDARQILAPTGVLRVGVYPGSPTSEVRDRAGVSRGLSVELGQELAQRLGVPVEIVEFPRIAEVVEAIVAGSVDMTVTNASPARSERISFTDPVVTLELGVLVPAPTRASALPDLNQPARRIGVMQGGTSENTLGRRFPQAAIVPIASLTRAREMLSNGQLDAFATNKAILFEMSDALPGSRVLNDSWGLEHLAIARPKGRETAAPFLADFLADERARGFIEAAVRRAGLRGQPAALP